MEKQNLRFIAELQFGTVKLEDIPCEIVFPKAQNEKVFLEAQLKVNDFLTSEIPFIFSLKASFSNAGNSLLEISAEKVYNLGIKTSYIATNQEYSVLKAEPVNLKIQQCIQYSEDEKRQKSFYFWLTQSVQLSPFCFTEVHYNGDISVKANNSKAFELVEGLTFNYYSALENLVNGYRDTQNFHYILEDDSYKEFSKSLKDFIKQHDLFKNANDVKENQPRSKKRELIYEKISELNRISFGTAFKSFCEDYQIELSDLWPLRGGEVSTSLTKIRNRLIHGGRFEREEYDAVICAKTHLYWTLERCILRVLDWDVEKSNVRPLFLRHCNGYSEWREKVSLLKSD